MKRCVKFGRVAVLLAMFCAGSGVVAAQGQGGGGAAPQPFMVHQLKPNVYWVEGGGGNSAVIVGTNGVIVVDAKTTAAGGKELLSDIAMITPKPVTTVFVTHSDGDHVNGLASFPKGVTIISQENCKTEMQVAPTGAPPRAFTIFAARPVALIFLPFRSSSLATGFFVWSMPGPWALKYMTFTSSSSFGLNFA